MIGLPKSEKWVGQKKMGGIEKGGKVERKAKARMVFWERDV